jgi:pimeloyl-ACP methyl ester carboxylesterase
MLNLLGRSQRFCDGLSRRSFLKIGAFGAGLTLADMLRARAHANPTGSMSSQKAAIMIFLPGGPSHMDMWDLKPEAPVEYRGEFRPIATNVPGVQISEHFPRQARMWDKLACVRSIVSIDEHSDSLVMTGYSENTNRIAHHPSFGSVVSRLRGSANADIPPFVSLRGMAFGCEPGYLGVAHRAFTPDGPGLQNLNLPGGLNVARSDDRRGLLGSFDTVRRDIDASGTIQGMDAFAQRAFDMVSSGAVRRALDLGRLDPRDRDRYRGIEQFLTARRLIEAGVGCVTLAYGGWDTHERNFETLRRQLPELDRGISSLVQDLHDRGMADDVVTVCWGEFGRTPRVNGNMGGRDHWAPVMSAMVAGGGLRMGQAVGSSSSRGEYPRDRRCTASQVLATIYRALGIDASMTFPNQSGRPMYVLDDREVVSELL